MSVDPVLVLDHLLRRAVRDALGCEAAPNVRRSAHADLQADVAPQLARKLRVRPEEIAAQILSAIPANNLVDSASVAPGGFLNVTISAAWLASTVMQIAGDARLAVPFANSLERVVIDFSSPNIAKELHVGHLRSTVIGDAIARLLEFRGHSVVRQNHIGDWGTPFGMLIEHLVDVGQDAALRTLGMGELSNFYRAARQKFEADSNFANRARQRVVLLQAGDLQTLDWWRILVTETTRYMHDVYALLDISLGEKDLRGESSFNQDLIPLALEIEASGRGVISDGALCVFPSGFTNRDGNPLPVIVRKRDGGFGYGATDLAAIRYRLKTLGATRLIYVVGAAQSQHLEMIFETARELGWLTPPTRAEHVAFGLVLGPDKKKLASRDGSPPRLVALAEDAIAAASAAMSDLETERARRQPDLPPLSEEAQREIARLVAIGSIKYADLCADRHKDYVFNLQRMVRFEGNTSGYAQYVYARVKALFRNTPEGVFPGQVVIEHEHERALALQLSMFGSAVISVETTLAPHHLVGYIYHLATTFTAFYEHCPVLRSDIPPAIRASRLTLAAATARTIECALSLMGIRVPERM